MTKLQCIACKTANTDVQIRESGDELCKECYIDVQTDNSVHEDSNVVSDNGVTGESSQSRTKKMGCLEFAVVLDKMMELCEKVGQILSIKDRI